MIVPQTSLSGPYGAGFHQEAQLVDFEQASALETSRIPVSGDPSIPFDHLPPPDNGLSFARLKPSSTGNGSAGTTATAGVAAASFESTPSPFTFSAETL